VLLLLVVLGTVLFGDGCKHRLECGYPLDDNHSNRKLTEAVSKSELKLSCFKVRGYDPAHF
jgi:hypothetical protein